MQKKLKKYSTKRQSYFKWEEVFAPFSLNTLDAKNKNSSRIAS